jgi:ACS family glucarate transporter-like MFS transporter
MPMPSSNRSEFPEEPRRDSDSFNPYQAPLSEAAATFRSPLDLAADSDAFGPPTAIRYQVLAFAVTMSILLYLHRFALSVAMPPISTELGLSSKQLGIATGVFFYVYALAQVPSGWLSDRFGARATLSAYVVLWSLAIGATGFIGGLVSLIICRGLLGLAQAGAYPCIASVNKRWFPVQRRGVANSSTTTGGRAGSMLATALTPMLMGVVSSTLGASTGQWRYVFFGYAGLGFVWALFFYRQFRETPDVHERCNEAERALIRGGPRPTTDYPLEAIPYAVDTTPADDATSRASLRAAGLGSASPGSASSGSASSGVAGSGVFGSGVAGVPTKSHEMPLALSMALSPTMWLLCGISTFVNVGWIFLVTFLPTYLKNVHGMPLVTIGALAALPVFAGMCGGMLGGIGTDMLVHRFGLVWGRRIPGLVATVGAGLGYLACLPIDNPYLLVVVFAMVGLLIDFGLGSLWAVYQDIAGRRVAAVLGFANMCGNLAAGFFPMVIGWWADLNRWDLVFVGSASALFITASCWAFVNPQRKIAAE